MTSYRPEYWRERAKKTRSKAESCRDINARNKLLRVAAEYEQLARRAEQWQTVGEQQQVRAALPANAVGTHQPISRSPELVLVYVNPSALRRESS